VTRACPRGRRRQVLPAEEGADTGDPSMLKEKEETSSLNPIP